MTAAEFAERNRRARELLHAAGRRAAERLAAGLRALASFLRRLAAGYDAAAARLAPRPPPRRRSVVVVALQRDHARRAIDALGLHDQRPRVVLTSREVDAHVLLPDCIVWCSGWRRGVAAADAWRMLRAKRHDGTVDKFHP